MRFLPYIARHLRRNWIRTASTVVAMSVCIFLFCTLETLVKAITWNLKSASASRLITRHSVSLLFNLPHAYKERIARVPGVKAVAGYNLFGGVMGLPPDFKTFFPNFAIEAEDWLAMDPEYLLTPEERQAFLADRGGCLVGPELAERFGWKKGDIVQLTSMLPAYRTEKPFSFVIRAIYRTDAARFPGTNASALFFHYEYLDEAVGRRAGIGMYKLLIEDPSRAGSISRAVDDMFENADPPTRTETEAAFRAGFISMAGNLAVLLRAIGLAVTFTILIVTANTMSMAVRDRQTEIAVLKTLGFSRRLVMGLVLGEALVLGVLGGGLGILLSRVAIGALPKVPFVGDAVAGFPNLGLTPAVTALGVGLALLLGLLAGLLPAIGAYRARIADALRTV
ncbi:MAG TPA: FtsX-like permease family protein [Vicinamibacteria bacterium]|nr:FtsX-like permease family protein [Vicinamibacteria bacterium]